MKRKMSLKIRKNGLGQGSNDGGQMRYDRYEFSQRERIESICVYAALAGVVAVLFYQSIIAFILLLPGLKLYLKRKREELLKKQARELSEQFKEAIMAVSASLGAGYSVENSFKEALRDLRNLYGENAVIVKEFENLTGRLAANETLEHILQDLSQRSGIEDISDFTEVFVTAKRTGGDLTAIIRRTAFHIGEKQEVKRDIETVMSSKKMEQRVMNVIPFGIVAYLRLTSPGFLDPLYHNIGGIVIMTICLGLYMFAFALSEKLTNIEV